MSYRFTNTDKWSDSWYSELRPIEKLLFNYLCDNCDIAGFVEVTCKKWANDINTDKTSIEGALKGLARGLIFSNSNDCIYIKNFLKHQKNLPLNNNNKAHLGILKRFELYSQKFNIQNVNEFIEGASKGLSSPTGIGIGIGIGNGSSKEEKFDFKKSLIDLGIYESIVNDWLKVRKTKQATNTETAFNSIKSEIQKSGVTANECIKLSVEKSWSGFKAEWYKNNLTTNNKQPIQDIEKPKSRPLWEIMNEHLKPEFQK